MSDSSVFFDFDDCTITISTTDSLARLSFNELGYLTTGSLSRLYRREAELMDFRLFPSDDWTLSSAILTTVRYLIYYCNTRSKSKADSLPRLFRCTDSWAFRFRRLYQQLVHFDDWQLSPLQMTTAPWACLFWWLVKISSNWGLILSSSSSRISPLTRLFRRLAFNFVHIDYWFLNFQFWRLAIRSANLTTCLLSRLYRRLVLGLSILQLVQPVYFDDWTISWTISTTVRFLVD